MKSTLPALFCLNSKQKRNQITLSPQKQIPYYNLQLRISQSYRTKIINPQHKKNIQKQKGKQGIKQRYSEYPSRSLSVNKDYNDNWMSTIQGYSSKSVNSLEQIDNVKINIKKVKQDLLLLSKAMEDVPALHESLGSELKQLGRKIGQDIDKMKEEYGDRIRKAWQQLSSVRRETKMELKSMRREVQLMRQQVNEQAMLVKDIQNQRATICRLHF